MKALIASLLIAASVMGPARAQLIWINEFHYDNTGADAGEFVEVAVPSSFGALSSVTLTLYNGGDGTSYATHTLDSFTGGATSGDFTFYSKLIPGMQNGAPDGFSLDLSGTVLQFLSYEGAFTAANGAANGLSSTDIGVSQLGTEPGGSSLGLIGSGSGYSDFSWAAFAANSMGDINAGQSFVAVPEPRVSALVAGLGLFGFGLLRRRWRRS